jgi:hypothetical protein
MRTKYQFRSEMYSINIAMLRVYKLFYDML